MQIEFIIKQKDKPGFDKCLSFGEQIIFFRKIFLDNRNEDESGYPEMTVLIAFQENVIDSQKYEFVERQRAMCNVLLYDLYSKGIDCTNTYKDITAYLDYIYKWLGYHICDLKATSIKFDEEYNKSDNENEFLEHLLTTIKSFVRYCERNSEQYINIYIGYNNKYDIIARGDFYEYFLQRCGKNLAIFEKHILTKQAELLPKLIKAEDVSINDHQSKFSPEIEKIKGWILQGYLLKFKEIEKELFNKGYIDNSYKWLKHKKELFEFCYLLNEYRYFKPKVKGIRCKKFHYRQFISLRYGYSKTGLSQAAKDYKASLTIEIAASSFPWIKNPE